MPVRLLVRVDGFLTIARGRTEFERGAGRLRARPWLNCALIDKETVRFYGINAGVFAFNKAE
jgi:hypothetical protein